MKPELLGELLEQNNINGIALILAVDPAGGSSSNYAIRGITVEQAIGFLEIQKLNFYNLARKQGDIKA